MTPAEPTIPAGEAERIGLAIETAWNGSGSKGRPNDLPPIELTEHERYHIGAAAFGAMAPRTPEPTGDTREQVAREVLRSICTRSGDPGPHDKAVWADDAITAMLEFAALPPARDTEDRYRAFVHAYVEAWEAGTGTVYLIKQAREALHDPVNDSSCFSASDGKEWVS